jgi:flagellar basal-body rod protein FlgF
LENPLYLVLSRMVAQTNSMDVIANNIANASTPGFKATNMQFASYVAPDGSSIPGGATLAYAASNGTWRDTATGAVSKTGSPLDLAITGDGYFQVKTPNGTRLTRDGSFSLLPDGTLATASGAQVLDTSGQPISIPQTAGTLTITGDGDWSDRRGRCRQCAKPAGRRQQSVHRQPADHACHPPWAGAGRA